MTCLAAHERARRHQLVPWRYVINLCGQDFPLKTNFKIVKSLQMLYGYNNVETVAMPQNKKRRFVSSVSLRFRFDRVKVDFRREYVCFFKRHKIVTLVFFMSANCSLIS